MRVLLINPPVLGGRYHSAQTAIPPLGLGYLAAAIRASGMECSVLDGKLDNPPIEVILAEVAARRPDVVGISAMTPDIVAAGKIAEAVKKSNSSIRVALGGAHAIARPRETLEEFPWVDYLVTGEGERTFTELLRSLSDGSDQDSILGLGFRKNGEIVINPPREYIRNLDETPFPGWDLFPGGGSVFFLLASWGCR
ncbi:MAG: radical SAM protein [Syntrophobacteraceae bacterium]